MEHVPTEFSYLPTERMRIGASSTDGNDCQFVHVKYEQIDYGEPNAAIGGPSLGDYERRPPSQVKMQAPLTVC